MTSVSVGELKRICRKGERDFFWISNVFWRPVSIYGSWLAVRLGVSANTITAISCLSAVASSFLLIFPSATNYVWSVILMQVFFYLDHVDGEIARYRRTVSKPAHEDLSGGYFDRLVHYFQGPSFFVCLGAGLSLATMQRRWIVLGVLAGVGSSGFPRFAAAYELLLLVLRRHDQPVQKFASAIAGYYALYWNPGDEPTRVYLVPRSWSEFVFWSKQLVWFPGHLFVFAGAVVLTVVNGLNLLWLELFLGVYAGLLIANTVYATYRYLRYLAHVPEAES